ncbi:hypothetical protein LMG28614_03862 [Paraburkholderia ultramafica]|uniref:DUF2968 domain-containing protein n=1 Tax=Paraburkholderia ultramafica TaxID=1544867 RepID=A0A6S7BB41_9BURK|nr:DUF2968 domain-containing protein [Paraburkholderia ultramafica]CAB3794135.1 hypothetical protein LMG28614_03862 [Paraburkholderia ultramafica]
MKHPLIIRRAMLLVASCALLQHAGFGLAAQSVEAALIAGMRPANSELMPQPNVAGLPQVAALPGAPADTPDAQDAQDAQDAASNAQGNVAELMRLIHDAKLSELRTTYNGSYGASLFFYPQEVTYYVALFQDKHFWRVIKLENVDRAEAIYAGFAQQTAQLADVEIRRTQLQAQKAYIENIIAISQDRAKRLQADLDVARTQQAKVDDYQRQTQGEAVTLHAEKEKAQAQLRQVQSEVMQLQRQTEFGLPLRNGLPNQK